MKRGTLRLVVKYVVLVILAIFFTYPLVWLFLACFKTNEAIFARPLELPKTWNFDAFWEGWHGVGQYSYGTFFSNTFKLVIPIVVFTLFSAFIVAYGFARFNFKGKKLFFALMISTMMLPSTVVLIPKYMLFNHLGWINTYKPFIIPVMFGGGPFFIYMLIQFIRGIPHELDEAATIDGCSSWSILFTIILPNATAALFSAGVFQFMWTWNNFFDQLVYITSVRKYTISLGLRMTLDTTTNIAWNKVLAMCLLSILPPTIIFFLTQRSFVEGVATSGIK